MVHLANNKKIRQTLFIRYFIEFIFGSFGNKPVIKADILF